MKATMMAYDYADRDTVMSEAYADWTNLCDVLQLFSGFIDSFDGSPTAFATAEPLMKKVFHPSFTLLTGMFVCSLLVCSYDVHINTSLHKLFLSQ